LDINLSSIFTFSNMRLSDFREELKETKMKNFNFSFR